MAMTQDQNEKRLRYIVARDNFYDNHKVKMWNRYRKKNEETESPWKTIHTKRQKSS